MNKELIKTYFDEFKHWLNGGNIQVYYKLDNILRWWTDKEFMESCNNGNDNFSHMIKYSLEPDDVLIVIDDEYVEFRKALAEGKTIQYNFGNYGINRKDFPNIWKDLDLSIGILADRACPENYRIKPEEPKFKVGDWITDGIEVWQHKENCRVKNQINWNLWQPKPGEWCWVYDKTTRIPVLKKFVCMNTKGETDYTTAFPYEVENIDPSSILHFRYIEPFIGQLPTILKD